MEFYLYLNGLRRGPFREEQVRLYLEDKLLQASDLASDGRDGEWKPLATFERFGKEPVAIPAAISLPSVTEAPLGRVTPLPAPAPLPLPVSDALSLALESLGPYARATLAPNETPYHRTSLHWIVFVRFALLALAAFFFLAIPFAIAVQALTASQLGWFVLPLPAFMMVAPTLAYVSSELVLTDIRVLIKTGVIQRQTLEMFISKVESIGIDQGFWGRLFDYGTVTIRGTGGFSERFDAIARPLEFRNWVQRLQGGAAPLRAPAPAGSVS
ncbi:MAG: PH domain-containing protein [Chthoniobacterales bacterium]|nr:PH domain-containing protein [Chthoniobacterales bacterium]